MSLIAINQEVLTFLCDLLFVNSTYSMKFGEVVTLRNCHGVIRVR